MGIMDRVADRIEREAEQAEDYGLLVHASADGRRTYLNESAGRLTLTSPGAPTLRVTVVGVDLAALC